MTFKKSMISIAAAGVIAAGLTGCGSSSNGTPPPPGPQPDPSGIQSTVKAVDGYVYNGKVEAWYLSDDNRTMKSVTLNNVKTTKNSVSGVWTVGSADYSLADTNASIKDKIRFFKLTGVASSSEGTTFTPATFIESGQATGYDGNDTILTPAFTMFAPANSAVLSPISNLVYQATSSVLGSTTTAFTSDQVELNTSMLSVLENNASMMATKLGLAGVNLLTSDPVALEASNPTLRLVNALLKPSSTGNITAMANSIMNATAATDLAGTLGVVKAALTDAGQNTAFVTDLETKAKAGSFTTADIANINIEKSVETDSYTAKSEVSKKGVFPVDSITVNTKNFEDLIGNGAKLQTNNINVVLGMSGRATDTNISNTSFSVLVKVDGDKDFVMSTDNNSSSGIAFKIPFDLNLTDGTIMAKIADTTMVPFEVKSSNGAEVVSSEFNASILEVTGVVSVSTTDVNIDVDAAIDKMTTKLDQNLTNSSGNYFKAGDVMDQISRVQVLILDADNKIIRTDSSGKYALNFPKSDFASLAGDISGNGIKVLDLANADFRTGSTGANSAPSHALTITTGGISGSGTKTAPYILQNNSNHSLNLGAGATDTGESNSTFAITSWGTVSAPFTDNNVSHINSTLYNAQDVSTAGAIAASNAFDVNCSSTTAGELNTTITYKVTDEFSEANTSMIYTTINRAPFKYLTEYNTSALTIAKDYDGDSLSFKNGASTIAHGSIADVETIAVTSANSIVNSDGSSVFVLDFNGTISSYDMNITMPADVNDSKGAEVDITTADDWNVSQ